jgi:hypothetical protein
MKKMILTVVLAASSLTLANAKTYDIVVSNPTKVGTVQLKPGEYRLKIDGTNAIFTSVDSSKSFTTPVKVENVDQKFDQTKMETTKDGDTDKLNEIDLGGSHTKLGF